MISLSGKSLIVSIALLGAVLVGCDDEKWKRQDEPSQATMRTSNGKNFLTAIRYVIEDKDRARAITRCDWGYEHLGQSRDNDEIRDWLKIIDACNAAVEGNWSEARAQLPR